jgi:hypothetical protein
MGVGPPRRQPHAVRNCQIRRKENEMPDGGKPNVLVIWSDDIGITNLSCYSDGLIDTGMSHVGFRCSRSADPD